MFIAKLIFLPNKCFQTVVSHMFRVWWILHSVWEGIIDTWKVVLFYMFLGSSITSFSAKTEILTKLKLFSNSGNNGNSLVYRKLRKVWCVRSSVSQAISVSLGRNGCWGSWTCWSAATGVWNTGPTLKSK